MRCKTLLTTALAGLLTTASLGSAAAGPFQGSLVQNPDMGQPKRGSIAGALSRLAFGPGDLARGTYALPLPVELPDQRGPIGFNLFPGYSAEGGLSEWGMGWAADLAIKRYRDRGDFDFLGDGFTSPWGKLRLGDDGAYYPLGLRQVVRVTQDASGWQAVGADGTVYRFEQADAVSTPDGELQWMLSSVETLAGDRTELTWSKNTSGRAFLTAATWGGRGSQRQYDVQFQYETLSLPYANWASGYPMVLDRRVKTLIVRARGTSGMSERWRYQLGYQQSPYGPAFYLASVTRTFPSGASEPPVTYDYDMGVEQLATATLTPEPDLGLYLTAGGGKALNPDHASMTDMEQNGLTDIEHYYMYTLVRQNESGFAFEALPAKTGAENPLCRPDPSINNKPRTLVRMTAQDAEPRVLVTRRPAGASATELIVCNRAGMTQADLNIAGAWDLGANTRIADVTRDFQPDFVQVKYGAVQVLENRSTDAGFAFAALPQQTLSPAFSPVSSWVLDFNGDGIADLVSRYSAGVVVWLGRGHGRFVQTGVVLQFRTQSGALVPNLPEHEFSFGDFNNDGRVDVLLSRDRNIYVFMNEMTGFKHVPVPGLASVPWDFSYPVVADLGGDGNEEVVFVHGTQADIINLTTPSTGLMRSANDGKGTIVRLGYGRVRPEPGIVHRYSILRSITIESTGYDPITYQLDYGAPVWHSVGRYLTGFASASKISPVLSEQVTFHNDDDVSGVVIASEDHDARTAGLVRFSRREITPASYHGVPWLRVATSTKGWRNGAGDELATRETVEDWSADLCPTRTSVEVPGGTLVREDVRADIPALGDLHCLPAEQHLEGVHADASLDFSYGVRLERNDLGQVTRVVQEGPAGDLVLQEISYDANHRVLSTSSPGHGTTTASYDALGRAVQVTMPTGVVSRATSLDPVTDAILALERDQGDGYRRTAFYHYDAYERLDASWDDFAAGTSSRPLVQNAYAWSEAGRPGRIETTALVDGSHSVLRRSADLQGADGELIAAAVYADGWWQFGSATIALRGEQATVQGRLAPLADGAMQSIGADDLRAAVIPLSRSESAGFGHASHGQATYQAGVTGTSDVSMALDGDVVVTHTVENGVYARDSAVDAAGRVLWTRDEAGVVSSYQYDALGRLVAVHTPDGDHRVEFDGYGRPLRVVRDGVASFEYSYDPVTGAPVRKRVLTPGGALVREATSEYDAIGRLSHLEHRDGATGETRDYWLEYDGHAGSSTIPGQRGFLSRVSGPGYERRMVYDRSGQVTSTVVRLGAWRSLELAPTSYDDGSVHTLTLTVRDGAGAVVEQHTRERLVDSYGRTAGLKLDGALLYTLGYDGEGRVARADFTDGQALVFEHDAVTGKRTGYRLETPGWDAASRWSLDARGLIASESVERDGSNEARSYGYDARGFLTAVDGPDVSDRYTYTASGLPQTIEDAAGARTVHKSGSELVVGGTTYRWDAAGRVVTRGDLTLHYGPDGEIDRATRPGREVGYVYDESGMRVLKLVDGAPAMAWLAGGVLTATGFVEPLDVEGVVVGVIDRGTWVPMLGDQRGTPVVSADGADAWGSAYGLRLDHDDAYAAALDYARLGWDADLETVRMGVRDYDPRLSQFWACRSSGPRIRSTSRASRSARAARWSAACTATPATTRSATSILPVPTTARTATTTAIAWPRTSRRR